MKTIYSTISLMVAAVALLALSMPVPAFSQMMDMSMKRGVVMKGFVQDIEDLASNRFEMSQSIPVHEDTAMPREVTGTLVPRVQGF